MADLNTVVLKGNLTRDPESRQIGENNTQVTDLSIAVNRKWKDKSGDMKEEVSFVDIKVWGGQAGVAAQYCTKGSPLLIRGRLTQDRWEDKESGKGRSKVYVTCEELVLLSTRGEGGAPARAGASAAKSEEW